MKKLGKLKLNQLANIELNEREMCRVLGGGTPGCCQCGCNYEYSGGSSTGSNDSANNAGGQYSDYPPQCAGCGSTSSHSGGFLCDPIGGGGSHSTFVAPCEMPQSTLCGN